MSNEQTGVYVWQIIMVSVSIGIVIGAIVERLFIH